MILLSIHPEFVNKILSGEKRYEFRKRLPKDFLIDPRVAVYATVPVCKVVGYFEVSEIVEGKPGHVWRKTAHGAGISKEYFNSYYDGKQKAFAMKIKRVCELQKAIPLRRLGGVKSAPQSYRYLTRTQIRRLQG